MWSYASSGWCVAHHQIVQSRAWDEVEVRQQCCCLRHDVIHLLHEHRPIRVGEPAERTRRERAVLDFQSPATAHDEPRLDVFALRQPHQPSWIEQAREPFDCTAHQQRALLPMLTKKPCGCTAAEQPCCVLTHGAHCNEWANQPIAQTAASIEIGLESITARLHWWHMLKEGDVAPTFELPDSEMELIKLSDFKGERTVVLYFYPKDDTPGCTMEAIDFSDLAEEFEAKQAIVLGVSMDDCLSHGSFRDKHGLS